MKTLILMRHAKSSWKDVSLPDHQRPLNKRGKRDAPQMGKILMDQGVKLDVILCSTAERARSTVKGFLHEYDFDGEVIYIDDLYGADPETYVSILNKLGNDVDAAMIVGHNPEMDHFLEMVCELYDHMTTASIAEIMFSIEDWTELKEFTPGELLKIWKPR